MKVDDEVAHLGVVDRLARFGVPHFVGLGVVRIDADEIELRYVLELDALKVAELAAEHEMEKLLIALSDRHRSPSMFMSSAWIAGRAAMYPSCRGSGRL